MRNFKPKHIRLILLMVFGMLMVTNSAYSDQKAYQPGQQAPLFSIPNHEGTMYSLKNMNKNGVILVFLSTQCPVSNAYNSRLIQMADYAKKQNLAFIGINSNATEDLSDILTHIKQKRLNFLILKDESNIVADKYGAKVTPEVFFIGKSFEILYHGPIDDNQRKERVEKRYLRNAIDAYLNGEEIVPDQIKPKGCIIKRMR